MLGNYECKLCHSNESQVLVRGIKDWEYGVPGEYEYHECVKCDQIQVHPFPSIDDLMKAYPDSYPAFIRDMKKSRGGMYKLLLSIHNKFRLSGLKRFLKSDMKVLDVGSGNGDFLECFKAHGLVDLHGIDFNENAIALMKDKGIKAFHGLFLDYSASPDTFDLVTMNHYLEHVLDPVAELKKAYAILKPGGILFGTLPNFNGLDRHLFKKYWGGNHVPRHTYQFTDKRLLNLLRETGFSNVKISHDMNPGHLAISIQNWLQRDVDDLKNNSRIKYGRMRYFGMLLLACLPVNALFASLKRSGTIGFLAEK